MGIKEEVLSAETQIKSYQFTDLNEVMIEKWGEERWIGEKTRAVREEFKNGNPLGYCKKCLCNLYAVVQ